LLWRSQILIVRSRLPVTYMCIGRKDRKKSERGGTDIEKKEWEGRREGEENGRILRLDTKHMCIDNNSQLCDYCLKTWLTSLCLSALSGYADTMTCTERGEKIIWRLVRETKTVCCYRCFLVLNGPYSCSVITGGTNCHSRLKE